MRAILALTLMLAAAPPAIAGTWQPRGSFSSYGHVAMGPDGTTLIGWPTWNDDADRSEVRYNRVADDGSFGPPITAGYDEGPRCCATGRGGASPTVIDSDGNATLIFGFRDESGHGGEAECCSRYETAFLPRGAKAAIGRERIEPSGRDRTGLQVAVTPGGARVGAWMVVRPRKPNRLIQVLDAPAGRGFGSPLTIADEPLQSQTPLRVLADRGRAAWVFWTTERESEGRLITTVRAARRRAGKRGWNVRTIAHGSRTDGEGIRIDGSSLKVAPGRTGELLVAWHECDGDGRSGPVSCRIQARWRRSGAWERIQPVTPPGVKAASPGLAMDRHGQALLTFAACQGNEHSTDGCTVQMARGQDGRFGAAEVLGPGGSASLAANRRGHVMLLYAAGEYGVDYARYARAGTITDGFEAPERMDLGYMTSCCGFAADDYGNFSFTAGGYDGGTFLLRYRR